MPSWSLQNSKNWVIFSHVEKKCQKIKPQPQCPKRRNIAKKLWFFSKPNWVARINIWIMPVQNLAILNCFGTSKLPISVPKVGCLRQNFSFDFTVNIRKVRKIKKKNVWDIQSIYRTRANISRGLYIFYPIFHCGLYCRAVNTTDNLCKGSFDSESAIRFSNLQI